MAEERERLMRAIEGLPPEDRRIILLYMQGYRTAETSRLLGISQSAVSNRLYRIRRRLQEVLTGDAVRVEVPPAALEREHSDVRFTAYWPAELVPREWYTVPVYAHVPGALEKVRGEAKKRLGEEAGMYEDAGASSGQTIARGAEIVVVPELAGCRFNPPSARFLWLEDCHTAEFRVQAALDLSGFRLGSPTPVNWPFNALP